MLSSNKTLFIECCIETSINGVQGFIVILSLFCNFSLVLILELSFISLVNCILHFIVCRMCVCHMSIKVLTCLLTYLSAGYAPAQAHSYRPRACIGLCLLYSCVLSMQYFSLYKRDKPLHDQLINWLCLKFRSILLSIRLQLLYLSVGHENDEMKHTMTWSSELTKHSAASSISPSWKRSSEPNVSAIALRMASGGTQRWSLYWNCVNTT